MRHIVALRGDPPAGIGAKFEPHPEGYTTSADLVAGIRAHRRFRDLRFGLSGEASGSANFEQDLDALKAKIDAGADARDHAVLLRQRQSTSVTSTGCAPPASQFRSCPASCRCKTSSRPPTFARRLARSVPDWLADRFEGLEDDPATPALVAAAVAAEQVARPGRSRRARLPFLHDQPGRPRLRHLPPPRLARAARRKRPPDMTRNAADTRAALAAAAAERILVLDGAMGTMIQDLKLDEADFRGDALRRPWRTTCKGNNDLLHPYAARGDPRHSSSRTFEAGADIIETNTFSSTAIAQADYGCEASGARDQPRRRTARARGRRHGAEAGRAPPLRRRRARPDQPDGVDLARRERSRLPRRHVRSSCGNAYCEATLRPDRRRRRPPAGRDDLRHAERQGRLVGASTTRSTKTGVELPIMLSGTITDLSGRTLSGQTPEAFWNSLRAREPGVRRPQLRARRARNARPYRGIVAHRRHARRAPIPTPACPTNSASTTRAPNTWPGSSGEFAESGLVNIVGGCCGTTPDHIRAHGRSA